MDDYRNHDFDTEITDLFAKRSFNFGKQADPIEIIKGAVLKTVCGWHNGSTAQSIITELGYVDSKNNLTDKGKVFLWRSFGWPLKEIKAIGKNAELHNVHE